MKILQSKQKTASCHSSFCRNCFQGHTYESSDICLASGDPLHVMQLPSFLPASPPPPQMQSTYASNLGVSLYNLTTSHCQETGASFLIQLNTAFKWLDNYLSFFGTRNCITKLVTSSPHLTNYSKCFLFSIPESPHRFLGFVFALCFLSFM
jgi:hypothetical protein